MKKSNTEVAVTLEKEISPIVEKARSLKIKGPKDMERSIEMLSQLNKSLDALIKSKEKLTKPINETLKEIRGRYKPNEAILEEAIDFLRAEQKRFQTEQVKLAELEASKIVDRVGEGKGKFSDETAMRKLDEIEKPREVVNTASGGVGFRRKNIVKVVDLSKIPVEFLEIKTKDVLLALEAGVTVPGAELDFEMIPVNSR